jgi:intein-encoded DNA endonuclease-like protein
MLEGDYEFEVSPNFVKKGVRVIGAAIGVPGSNQLARTADYLWKYSQDELKREPRNVAEFAQGVLFTGDRR